MYCLAGRVKVNATLQSLGPVRYKLKQDRRTSEMDSRGQLVERRMRTRYAGMITGALHIQAVPKHVVAMEKAGVINHA